MMNTSKKITISVCCIILSFFTNTFSFVSKQANDTQKIKVLMVVAHDAKQSLTYSIYDMISDFLLNKSNVEIINLDLYDEARQIPFYTHDQEQLESSAFYQKNKEFIMQADRLILFFPIYWYSAPGIVKTWLELITNYAWQYKEGEEHAKPLHHINKVLSINSATAKQPWYKFLAEHPAQRQITDTFKFMGIKSVKNYMIYNVNTLTPSVYNSHLGAIKKLVEELLV